MSNAALTHTSPKDFDTFLNNSLALANLADEKQQQAIIGRSEKMQQVFHLVEKVADCDSTILITGETGTGKGMVARAIHENSQRKNKPFISINCGAIPENLLESELFGHVRVAFTGATVSKSGKFELARGGTVFLDEIGDMSPDLQVKVLKVLEEGEFEQVGGTKTIKVDVRIIAATNRDLPEEVQNANIVLWDLTPDATVAAVVAVITHHEVMSRSNHYRKVSDGPQLVNLYEVASTLARFF